MKKSGAFLLCSIALLGIANISTLPYQSIYRHGVSGLTGALDPIVPRIKLATIPAVAPMIQGWGGVTLDEAANGQLQPTLERLNQSGYNAVRIGFSGGTGISCSSGELGSWDPGLFTQAIQAAQQYHMWVILDYHSYSDLTDSACQQEWLTFWTGVLTTNWNYDKIIWEPINEPAGSVTLLSTQYQAWITQARVLGDTHWIVIENSWSNGSNPSCSFDILSLVACYPMVTDPLNETFLSIHPYFFYDSWEQGGYGSCSPSATNTWDNNTAECAANTYYRAMQQSAIKYHMPILDTEGGAVYYSCNNACASPPDAVGTDDASYSRTTFHFMQYLTTLMDSSSMGWVWWEAGEGSCCGALDTWGSLLSFQTNPPPKENPPSIEAPTGESVIAGSKLSFGVNATDPDLPPQNLTLSCNSCPSGASFPIATGLGHVSGMLFWTPNSAQIGTYSVTFTVTDGIENSDATVSIQVTPSNKPPSHKPPILTIPGNQTITVSDVLVFNVTATDPNNPPAQLTTICLNCDALGATLTTSGTSRLTGIFRWGPGSDRVAQSYVAEFSSTDGTNSTSATVSINIVRASLKIEAVVSPPSLTLGSSQVPASDAATLSLGFNPTGDIRFSVFGLPTCVGAAVFTGSTMIRNGNGVYLSPSFYPQINGTYYWVVAYDGDQNNYPYSTQCGAQSQTLTVQFANPQRPSNGSPPVNSTVLLLSATGVALSASLALTLGFYKRRSQGHMPHSPI